MAKLREPARALLLILIVLLVAVLFVGFWARQELYNTDRFVDTVAKLSAEPAIQASAAQRISQEIETLVQDRDVLERVPGDLATLYRVAKPQIETEIQNVLASPDFQTVWIDAVRTMHPPLKAVLQGKDTEMLETVGNEIRINLYPVYEQVVQRLEQRGITFLSNINPSPERFWVTAFEADRLVDIQEGLRTVNRLLFVLAVILPILAVVYLYLSRNRWRAAGWLALAVLVGLLLQRLALYLARREMLNALENSPDQQVARVFFDALVDELQRLVLYAGIAALAVAVGFLAYDYYRSRRPPEEMFPPDLVPAERADQV